MFKQPLAEIFGFPISNEGERARRYLRDKLCPYNNIVSSCTKNSVENPLGVCSLSHNERPVIICPVRFREDWMIVSDAAGFVLDGNHAWTHVSEVRLKDRHGKSAGNIDYVLVSYDEKGRVIDFGSLEVQAVYISGNLTGPFQAYVESPSPDFVWDKAIKYPHPDYLSSSRKRLIPQIVAKGSILKQWSKKQAVALQTSFYQTLPKISEVAIRAADFAFLLYELKFDDRQKTFHLVRDRVVYTKFDHVMKQIAKFEAGSIEEFTEILQRKVNEKRKKRE